MAPFDKLLDDVICKDGMLIDLTKVVVILLAILDSQHVVHTFLSHIGYYYKHIKNYACISLPLEDLLHKGEPFV